MKKEKLILLVLGIVFILSSCETLKDPEVEYGPVYPLSAEWIVRFIAPNAKVAADTSSFSTVTISNTADNSTSSLWIRKTGSNALVGAFTVKAACNVPEKTFSVSGGTNTVLAAGTSVGTVTITEGKVITDGWDTNSGYKSDKITFKIEDSRKPGKVYTAEGYRRTGWAEDEP